MARESQIDKRIAELEAEIAWRQHAIDVLRQVQKPKRKPKPHPLSPRTDITFPAAGISK